MDVDDIIKQLSPTERALVPHLEERILIPELAKKAQMQEVEVMRACQYLSNKGVLTIEYEEYETYSLSEKGQDVVENGLPEQQFLSALPASMQELGNKLGRDEVNASIGILKRAGAIQMGPTVQKIKDVDFSEKLHLLQLIQQGTGTPTEELLSRGLVQKTTKTKKTTVLTETGKKLLDADISHDYVEKLTPEMLKNGTWKDAQLRHYDVTSKIPAKRTGRVHYVQEAIENIKRLWIEMGFTEMEGTIAQTAFWDLDTLFVPQDHPAREMQDTFYLKNNGQLPSWWQKVKDVHENGADTGSTGWQTSYSEEEAKRVLLRTHTTVLSAQMLSQLDPETDLPAKFFSVNKVFRNETLDWKHLFEFHQVEGIVVGEDLSLSDLIGLQKQFYLKMGFTDVRFRPAYFPYTEPSCEVEVFHPVREEWIELGGMGVFRPEVVKTLLGKDVPVLAWGLGMERIITDYYNIKDLREIYTRDINKLQEKRAYLEEKHANN